MGYVYVMNANTGKLLWKKPVGKHNGHDNDAVLAMQHKLHLKLPYLYYPGIYGGVETNMALAEGVIYVPVTNLFAKFTTKTQNLATNGPFAKGTGEMVALNLATGKVLWDRKLPHTPYGDATVTNDLVFTTTFDGKVIALSRSTGAIVWREQLPAGTNSSVSVNGNMLITAASFPMGKGQKPEIVAYSLNAPAGGPKTQTVPSPGASSNQAPPAATGTTVQVKGGEFSPLQQVAREARQGDLRLQERRPHRARLQDQRQGHAAAPARADGEARRHDQEGHVPLPVHRARACRKQA